MRHLKRGGGGADPRDAAVLDFVGLGKFARLSLPDHPPDELGLSAFYDCASGRITVSFCGAGVSASPADLAGALGLPMGPVRLPAGVDAAAFCTGDAIEAVKRFVCDRVLLGWGGSGAVSMEVDDALRLVDEGKAYDVDWGGLIWAVVKGEVVAGTPWPYAPYLLHLMECQIPGLFAQSLPLGKRFKGQVLQQCQLEDGEEASLAFLGTQNIGELEEMPTFGSQSIGFFPQPPDLGGNISHFQAIIQRIQGYELEMNRMYLDKEQACRDTQHEVKRIKGRVMEKDKQIEATVKGMQQDLLARGVVMQKFKADKDQLCSSVQHYRKLLKKSLAKFQAYKKMVTRGEGVDSEGLGITGGHHHTLMHQIHSQFQMIKTCGETWESIFSKRLEDLTKMERGIASLNHEVERLKNCRSIPDLNNGVEDDVEGKASLAATLGASWTGDRDRVSNITQGGKQLVGLIANPDKRNDTRESMDLDGAQSGTKLCR